LDNTLVEVKTTKKRELDREIFNQLAGYYFLSCIGGIDDCAADVREVAVYFARYGIFHRIAVEEFCPPDRREPLLKQFRDMAAAKYNCAKHFGGHPPS
jgi:hypothetical protein